MTVPLRKFLFSKVGKELKDMVDKGKQVPYQGSLISSKKLYPRIEASFLNFTL